MYASVVAPKMILGYLNVPYMKSSWKFPLMTTRWQQIVSVIVVLGYSRKCEFINRAASDTTAMPWEVLPEYGHRKKNARFFSCSQNRAIPVLGMKPKRGCYVICLFFKIGLTAISFKRSGWDLSIHIAEHGSMFKITFICATPGLPQQA